MTRLLIPIIIILEGICLWHAYKTEKPDRWFYLIVGLPFFGCVMYFFTFLLKESNLDNLTESVKETLEPNYKTEKIEKETGFTDTFANKMKLGEQYVERGRFVEAIKTFESCLSGFNVENPDVFKRLLKAHYLNKDYISAAKYGQKLEQERNFEKTDEMIAYAWALHYLGNSEEAEATFKKMDIFFSNYKHRFEYAVFLVKMERKQDAKDQLKELLDEFEQMDKAEQRMKRGIFREIKTLYQEVSKG